MGGLWFVIAAVCVVAGLLLLWFDRRRRRAPGIPARASTETQPGDLFRESHPHDRRDRST